MKNLDMLMTHAHANDNSDEDDEKQSSNQVDEDPRPPILVDEFELLNFLDPEDVDTNAAALHTMQEEAFLSRRL